MFTGTPTELLDASTSVTGQYLRGGEAVAA